MRWILGAAWRVFKFWSVWFALLLGAVILLEAADASLSGRAVGFIARLTLFVSTALLLISEWSLVSSSLLRLEALLKEAELTPPPRWERGLRGLVPLVMLLPFWGVGLEFFSPVMERLHQNGGAKAAHTLLGVASLCWSVVTLLLVSLALGGFSLLRYRVAARKLPPESRPELKPMMPWLVATWSAGALALALVGMTGPRVLAAVGQVGLALLVAYQDAPGPKVELILELGPDDSIAEVLPTLALYRASAERALPEVEPSEDEDLGATWLVTVPADEAAALQQLLAADTENVDAIELNAAVSAVPLEAGGSCLQSGSRFGYEVNDPLAGGQRAMDVMGGWEALALLKRGSQPQRPILVALIDTGVDGTHEDLQSVMLPRPVSDDRDGHGTASAGLIAGVGDNYAGLTSFNLSGRYIRLRSYPALAGGSSDSRTVAVAIMDAVEDRAEVINLSFGARGAAPMVVRHAIEYARASGVLVVAAAGNHGLQASDAGGQWPANIPGVLAVGALNSAGERAAFSNTTRQVSWSVSAPGEGVCSLRSGGGYARTSGTSVAAPLVSGLAGTLRAICPNTQPDTVARLLIQTGLPVEGLGPSVRADKVISSVLGPYGRCP